MTIGAPAVSQRAPGLDPPGVSPPSDELIRQLCRKCDPLVLVDGPQWQTRFEPFFGPGRELRSKAKGTRQKKAARRFQRRRSLTLVSKTLFTHAGFLDGNVYRDGPGDHERGISVRELAGKTGCTIAEVKGALEDLKTAGIERFDRCPFEIKKGKRAGTIDHRRLPKAQPRSEEKGVYSAEPAIRCIDWKAIGRIFGAETILARLQKRAEKKRDEEGRRPLSLRQQLMAARRAAKRKAWRALNLRNNRLATPERLGSVLPGAYERLGANYDPAQLPPAPQLEPDEIMLAEQLERARAEILIAWRRKHGTRVLPTDAEVDAAARKQIGAPERHTE